MNIKEIEIGLENFESVIIPFECFKKFHYAVKDANIETLTCLIEDKREIRYSGILIDNNVTPMISPIQRLAQFNDISEIKIIYDNNQSKNYSVIWGEEDSDNNKYQKSELLSYKKVYIKIEPYIESYTIFEIFNFPNHSKFKIIDDEVSNDNYKGILFIEDGILKFETTSEEFLTQKCSNKVPISKETVNFHYVLVEN